MANLTATSAWSDVLQLETTHQAIAGAGGTMNLQAQSLINRTQYLADNKFDTADFLTTLKTNLNASGTAPVYACRAWVNFNSKVTPIVIRASGNVSSITDNGVGMFRVNFITAMQDNNYAVTAIVKEFDAATATYMFAVPTQDTYAGTYQVGSFGIDSKANSTTWLDVVSMNVMVFR